MKVIKFPMEALISPSCCEDFYKEIGLWDMIRSGQIKDISQFWMNHGECYALLEAFKCNLKKDKRFKHCIAKHVDNVAGLDWVGYSPVSSHEVPPGELWVWGEDEYEAAMERHRDSCRAV